MPFIEASALFRVKQKKLSIIGKEPNFVKNWQSYLQVLAFGIITTIGVFALSACSVSQQDGATVLTLGFAPAYEGNDTARNVQNESNKGVQSSVSANKHFMFNVQEKPSDDDTSEYDVEVYYRGSKVAEGSGVINAEGDQQIVETLSDTPARGCETTMVYSFEGNAHGDCEYQMAISCGSSDYLYKGGTSMCAQELEDVNGDGVKELALLDSNFAYYDPDGAGENSKRFLPFGESPHMVRYAVWTSRGWSVSEPGELPEVYAKLLKEQTKGPKDAGSAIQTAYYALMAGQDAASAKKILQSMLPKKWISISDKVFTDIQTAVSRKDFITQVPLSR
jgi:hypothetical protein